MKLLAQIKAALILLCICVFCESNCFADVLQHHPSSPAHLGSGYSGKDPFRPYAQCIEIGSVKNIDSQRGAAESSFNIRLIRERKDLYDALNVSASIEAQATFFSANASVSFDKEVAFSSDSLVWVAVAKTTYGRYVMANPGLKEPAKNLLATPSDFENQCGPEYIAQESRGALVAVIFTVNNVSSSEKQQLVTAAGGSYGVVTASASYNNLIKKAVEQHQVNISFYARGGPGLKELAPLAAVDANFAAVQKVTSDYIAKITPRNAQPLEYLTAPMSNFGYNGRANVPDFNQQTLYRLSALYKDISAISEQIYDVIRPGSESPLLPLIPQKDRDALSPMYQTYLAKLKSIHDIAKQCRDNTTTCNVPDFSDLPSPKLPRLPPPLEIYIRNVCKGFPLRHVDAPDPPPGTQVGYIRFTGHIMGHEMSKIELLRGDIPLGPLQFVRINREPGMLSPIPPWRDSINPFKSEEDCSNNEYSLDKADIEFFGSADLLKGSQLILRVTDKYGRVRNVKVGES
jgi:hypothetical protein